MDMADLKMPKANVKEIRKNAMCCWDAMTENNIELRLRFSLMDIMIAALGIGAVTAGVCAVKRAHHDRMIAKQAKKSAKEEKTE